jgi:hypothetical protein
LRKLLALLAVAPHAALSQTHARDPAAPPDPPRPVMSEAVTDARLRALFDSAREAMTGMRFDEALRLSDEGIAASPNQPAFWLNRSEALYARGVTTRNRFYRSAVEAASQAKFTPTLLSGQPVKVGGLITYNFVLQQ